MSGIGGTLARRWVEEIMAGKLDAVDEVVAPDYVEHAMATFGTTAPGQVDGPTHTRQVVGMLRSQFPDLTMDLESTIEEGDLVAVRVMASGTNSGAGVMPATGGRFNAEQSHWFKVEHGRLAEHWAVRDDLTAMIQIGLVTPPGRPG